MAAIMNEPENFNAERIKFFIEENMPKSGVLEEVMKSQPAGRPQQAPAPAVAKSLNVNPGKKKQEEEFSMDNLMMQELLSRSAAE